jgi:hypothetical protein
MLKYTIGGLAFVVLLPAIGIRFVDGRLPDIATAFYPQTASQLNLSWPSAFTLNRDLLIINSFERLLGTSNRLLDPG